METERIVTEIVGLLRTRCIAIDSPMGQGLGGHSCHPADVRVFEDVAFELDVVHRRRRYYSFGSNQQDTMTLVQLGDASM
jgi:hypothetical protein